MTATPTLTVRHLPTPFDPASGPVTVATPSCCCCCCCCLASLGMAVGVAAGAAYETGRGNRTSRAVATVLAVLALPLALATWAGLFNVADALSGGEVGGGTATVVFLGVVVVYATTVWAAMRAAGASWQRALTLGVSLAASLPVAVVVEAIAALFTLFFIELLAPGAVAFGLWVGRRTHQGPEPPPWPPVDPQWVPPVPPPPVPGGPAPVAMSDELPALPAGPAPSWAEQPTPEDDR
jgi:streptolysin S family bacteriocin protoxin